MPPVSMNFLSTGITNMNRFAHSDILCKLPCEKKFLCGHKCEERCGDSCRCICDDAITIRDRTPSLAEEGLWQTDALNSRNELHNHRIAGTVDRPTTSTGWDSWNAERSDGLLEQEGLAREASVMSSNYPTRASIFKDTHKAVTIRHDGTRTRTQNGRTTRDVAREVVTLTALNTAQEVPDSTVLTTPASMSHPPINSGSILDHEILQPFDQMSLGVSPDIHMDIQALNQRAEEGKEEDKEEDLISL
jgi:hypothetical protein